MNYRENYYQQNKENIKAKNSLYYLKNRDKRIEQMHIYRVNNSDGLKEIKNEKFTCICGGKYTYSNRSKHYSSKKHLKYRNDIIDKIIDRIEKRMA
jgi:hypothetical protein